MDTLPLVELRVLSHAELLGLVLQPTGSRLAESQAAAILARAGGAAALARCTPFELARLPGMSARSAARVAAALELGCRIARAGDAPRPVLSDSRAVLELARSMMLGELVHEELWVLAVDAKQRLRAKSCVARGGLHGLHVAVRDPLRFALRSGASAILLVHNHPSGDPSPSAEDLAFTDRFAAAADAVGTPLLDHVIVAGTRHRSLLDDGLIGRTGQADLVRPAGDTARGSRIEAPRSEPRGRAENDPSHARDAERPRSPPRPSPAE